MEVSVKKTVCAVALAAALLAAEVAMPDAATTGAKDLVEVRPDQIRWQPHPAVPAGQFAVLVGSLREAQPLVVRIKLPPNITFQPHTHPEARTYTVLSGEWKLGLGEKFDAAQLRSYPAGSVYRLGAKVPHYQATGATETIVQIESIGPTSTDFLKPAAAR
jgi:quercetin dioxygenase-like cupin family protein